MVKFNIRSLGMKILLCLVISSVAASISAQNYSTRRQGSYPSRPMRSYSSSEANAIARNVYNMYSERMDKDKTNDKDKVKDKKKDKKDKKKDLEDTIQEQPSLNENGSSNEGENAPLSSDDVELVATGDGSTKKEATLSALRDALEQVYGTMVSSNTQILNDELVKDEIVSISTGVVKKYTYLSEKEVDGKCYVVLKAIVSPQKLVTFVQQKGGSTELAGATFAANVRLKKLNEQNARIASENLTKMQMQIFPQCIDVSISEVSEPYQFHYNRSDEYTVSLTLQISLNANAAYIQELEKQKEACLRNQYTSGFGTPLSQTGGEEALDNCYKAIFDHIKIVDDTNEYHLKYSCKYDNYLKYNKYIIEPISKQSGRSKMELTDINYVSKYICDSKGKWRGESAEDPFVYIAGSGPHIIWKEIKPDRPIIVIPIKIVYSLDDLEKVTGINAVLSTDPIIEREDIYSMNEEEFATYLINYEALLRRKAKNASDDFIKSRVNEMREKYRNGK